MPLGELALEPAPEVAFHGGRSDALPAAQAAAVDAVQVLLIDSFLERLAGPLAGQDAGQRLAGVTPAAEAFRFGDLDLQETMAEPPVLVADRPAHPALAAQSAGAAMRAGSRPDIPGRDPHPSLDGLNVGNLKIGQTQNHRGFGQNVISQDCFTNPKDYGLPPFLIKSRHHIEGIASGPDLHAHNRVRHLAQFRFVYAVAFSGGR